MAVDFSRSSAAPAPQAGGLFGRSVGAAPVQGAAANDRPKADLWLNVGYLVNFTNDKGEIEQRFVSLPMGLALDTMDPVSTKGSSDTYRQFQAARNGLLDSLITEGKKLQPGQDFIIEMEGGQLAIQIRRVAAEQADVSPDNNPFARNFSFALGE